MLKTVPIGWLTLFASHNTRHHRSCTLGISIYDNDDVHLEVHGAQLKSTEAENWPMQARIMLETHFGKHLQRKISLAPSNIKTTLRLQSGITPDVAALALQSEGLRTVTPDMFFNEEVMDTWKTQDTSEAAVDPQTIVQQAHAEEQLQQLQEKHTMEMAQMHQQIGQADEMHQAKLQAAKRPKGG